MVTGVAKLHDTTFRRALSGDDEEVLSRPMLVSPSDKLPASVVHAPPCDPRSVVRPAHDPSTVANGIRSTSAPSLYDSCRPACIVAA